MDLHWDMYTQPIVTFLLPYILVPTTQVHVYMEAYIQV